MQSLDSSRNGNGGGNDEALAKAVLLLIAVGLNALELFIPRIPVLPWLKPGLANAVTMLWIVRFGTVDALLYSVLRIWISGFYFGFSLLTLGLALGGGVLSTVIMGLAWDILGTRRTLGTIGMGMIGALAHNTGQLAMVWLLVSRNALIFYQIPFMLAAAAVFGALVGAAVPLLDNMTAGRPLRSDFATAARDVPVGRGHAAGSIAIMLFCFSLLAIKDPAFLLIASGTMTIAATAANRFSLSTLLYPLRFWILFLFVGSLELFFSYGTRFDSIPWVTHEGLAAAAGQSLRLWAWLEAVFILRRFRFHNFFFALLRRVFPRRQETLSAGLIALEFFPEIARISRGHGSGAARSLFRSPRQALSSVLEIVTGRVEEMAGGRSGRA